MTWLKALAVSTLLIFAPLKSALVAVMVLCLADMVIGIISAKKHGRPITSAGLQRTMVKLCVFEVVLGLTFLAETYLSLDTIFPAVKTVSALIASTELLSIFENLNQITGKNLLKTVIKSLGSKNDSHDS